MTATAAPFGFQPTYHVSGLDRARRYPMQSAYGTQLYKGQMVLLSATGFVQAAPVASDFLGVVDGFEFIDSNGKPNFQNTWPAGQICYPNTVPVAWVWDDPNSVFRVQASGSVALSAIGNQADVINPNNGSIQTGLSTAALNAALSGVGVQGQWRVTGVDLDPNNAWGDSFTILQVQMARSQYIANKIAI